MKTTTTSVTSFFLLALMTVVSHGFMVAPPCHVPSLTNSKPAAAGECRPKPYNGVGPLYSDSDKPGGPDDGNKEPEGNEPSSDIIDRVRAFLVGLFARE